MIIDHPIPTFIFALCALLSALAWLVMAWSIVPRTSSMPRLDRIVGSIGLTAAGLCEGVVAWYVLFRPEMPTADLGGSWVLVSSAVVATVGLCAYTGALFARAPMNSHLVFVTNDEDDAQETPDVILVEAPTTAEDSELADPDGKP